MSKQVKSTKSAKATKSDDFVSDDVISSGSESYFRPESGDNKIRVVSKPILGWLAWDEDEDGNKKPNRSTLDNPPTLSDYEKDNQPKKFMAVLVLDHSDGLLKIWELTQQSIIKAIKALAANPDWGNPFTYDLTIGKKGEKLKTKYTVTPSPKKPLSKEAIKEVQSKPCNLDALYEGEDPWAEDQDNYTEVFVK